MPTSTKKVSAPARQRGKQHNRPEMSLTERVEYAVDWLKRHSSKAKLEGMARYAIPSDNAFGVSVSDIQSLGKSLGKDHALAAALWKTGHYEARMLAAYVDEPARVTPAQMNRWCREFDNWAICDTVCFALFDRTPHAWDKVEQWSRRQEEFIKRAGFALLWALNAHYEGDDDEPFARCLGLIERGATDERNFVKKAVNMALRSIGKRSRKLHASATALAQRLADSANPSARWVGKDALRELRSPAVARRLAAKD